MLIATAGHIDHGKTALVRALTGVETDRLPQERQRGISIDLGFAYWRPDDGDTIGFVDVPGHDRFIRNMLAGIFGVDMALLVVAADDGVMPQTIEHVEMLDLLGIDRGLVAISKADRAAPDRIADVKDQVRRLLARTKLANAPMIPVSAVAGEGLDALGAELLAMRSRLPPRTDDALNFRLAIDRAFTVIGAGTVASGTIIAGAVRPGDRLMLQPRGISVRVRGVQSGNRQVPSGDAGQRSAINLAGIEVGDIHRGDWLVAPAMDAVTDRVEVAIRTLADRGKPLRHNTPVHLHHGTADISARVLVPRGGSVASGEETVVQLALARRTSMVVGELFVLRDQSGRELIGGGRVIDPFVAHKIHDRGRHQATIAALRDASPRAALAALFTIPTLEVETRRFERTFNLTPEGARRLYVDIGAVLIGRRRVVALPAARVAKIEAEVAALLENHHQANPSADGLSARAVRARLVTPVSAEVFAALLKDLAERDLVKLVGAEVRLPSQNEAFSLGDEQQWSLIRSWIEDRGIAVFSLQEVATELRMPEAAASALLYRRRKSGEIYDVTDRLFLTREHVAALAATAAMLGGDDDNRLTAAQFRDATGIGRNMVIRILEFFDRIGITARRDDQRVMRRDFEDIVGTSPPYRVDDRPS